MCKATEYAGQLINVFNNIGDERNRLSQKLSDLDLAEQDLLHKLEFEKFNIVQGYDLAKGLKDIRNTRRNVKNELRALEDLMRTTCNFIKPVTKAKSTIGNNYFKIVTGSRYNPRKINFNNDIRIEVKTIIGEVK